MPTFRLVLEYDGTDFEGWQIQHGDKRTIQGCLLAALRRIAGGPVWLVGAGRTDAGVHAEGQVASARLETHLPIETLLRAVNGNLPPDVAVRRLALVPDDFHARRHALRKLYRYRIWHAPMRSPLRARHTLWVQRRLDLAAVRAAAEALVGEHDFASFQAAGTTVRDTVRRLESLALREQPDGELVLEFLGSGFLRHMVRNLVGTLLEVGQGTREAASLAGLLAARDRRLAGPTAPAHGLVLVRVDYALPMPGGAAEAPGPGLWPDAPAPQDSA